MNYKSALAVMVALFVAVSAVPLSESVADRPGAVLNGFVLESSPTQADYDKYLCDENYVAMNVIYALGLYNGCFNYKITLSNIDYDTAAYYENYYFDTDETGVEQYITYIQNATMNVKLVATVDEYYGGYDLFMESLVGDVNIVKDRIGTNFRAGDTITVEAKLTISTYTEYDETDMLRTDGLYIVDSWDCYSAYVMDTSGTAVFSIGGRTTEATFDTHDGEANIGVCNWRYSTDISDVNLGDSFDYDRNNRLLYNSHFCEYKIGNGAYTISDTDNTSSSYMDREAVIDENDFYSLAELNSTEYIYDWIYGYSSTDIAKIGTLNKSVKDAVFKVTTDKVNIIDDLSVNFYDQEDIDDLNKTINDLNKKADQNKTIMFVMIITITILIVLLIAVALWKNSARRNV